MEAQHFQTSLQSDEVSSVLLEVPGNVIASLGKGKRPPVRVTLNGFLYRTTVAVYGGKYYVPVRKEVHRAAGLAPGEIVAVAIELDVEPRVVDVPEDLARELASNLDAQSAFERLSYTHRKEYVDWISDTKRPETRRRRVGRALDMLVEGRKEP